VASGQTAIHSSAAALHKVGTMDQATMCQFDETCLAVPANLAPTQIKNIRAQARVSQPVFARYLNTSESTVQKWESGSKQPSGMALKLLAVVQKHGLGVLA
jgi:putative transcriptional regulator